LISPAPVAAKIIIATTIGPLWEELLTRGLLFRAVSGSPATVARAITRFTTALVFNLAHFNKDWVGRMWAFASAYGWIRLASHPTIPAVVAHRFYNITVYNVFRLMDR
jgi:membrane protease YdiL (CAAX protease family)